MMNKLENFNFENSSKEMLRTIDVHDLLPQQEPFVMIGSLVHLDKILTVTKTEVQADNIFVDQNHFSASGLMENIAQTCAARIGYINKYILKKGIQLGFIGAVRNFEVISLPEVGDVITTRVEVKEEVFGMTLAEAVIMCGDKVLVTSDMKIAVKQQHEA
ncbi:MAG: pseudouridylate synthase [Prevotella sp.]|nr:pseudouridylate synthase [Prevotella sp.]